MVDKLEKLDYSMKEVRCPYCGKMLFMANGPAEIEIKCTERKCKRMIYFVGIRFDEPAFVEK